MELSIKETGQLAPAELVEMFAERVKVFVVEQECAYPEVDADDFEAVHVRGVEGGNLIAYARILERPDHFAVGRVLVVKDHRGRGLSYKIMAAALDYIEKIKPGSEVRLSAQTYITGLYQSLGFEIVSEEYLEDGIPHVDMVRARNH